MTGSSRRLFFALWPGTEARSELLAAAAPAIAGSGGRPLPADALHLTLVFLGAVPEDRLEALRQAAAAVRAAPFSLTFDATEHWRGAQVLCATAGAGTAAAAALAKATSEALLARGFAPDVKPFRAHVTLKRKVQGEGARCSMPPVTMAFREFVLVESRTGAQGAVYSVLQTWTLYERENP